MSPIFINRVSEMGLNEGCGDEWDVKKKTIYPYIVKSTFIQLAEYCKNINSAGTCKCKF